ncbi:MAG: rhodanese-like domain-containing protein, partial [Acetatifactor muris]|nr:rhodanese-like domain-containing protein [Acetatifactor muris]
IWIKDLCRENSNKKAVAFLNRSNQKLEMKTAPEEIGLSDKIKTIRDVLDHVDVKTDCDLLFEVEPHGCKVFVIEAEQAFKIEDRSPQYQAIDVKKVNIAQAEEMVREGAVWVDVRSREEYAKQHFEQAVNIPYTEIHAAALQVIPDKHAIYILYCNTGKRSYQAAASLMCLGYINLFYFGQ